MSCWTENHIICVVKKPDRENDHLPPTSVEVKKMWIYTSTPLTPSLHNFTGFYVGKAEGRDRLAFQCVLHALLRLPFRSRLQWDKSFIDSVCTGELRRHAVAQCLSSRIRGPTKYLKFINIINLCVCGLVVRPPGCRHRGPGFDFQLCQILWVAVGLEWGPLSPCEDKWGATWKKSSGYGLQNWD
jgi:hypothetical protein